MSNFDIALSLNNWCPVLRRIQDFGSTMDVVLPALEEAIVLYYAIIVKFGPPFSHDYLFDYYCTKDYVCKDIINNVFQN